MSERMNESNWTGENTPWANIAVETDTETSEGAQEREEPERKEPEMSAPQNEPTRREDGAIELSMEDIGAFTRRLSGKGEDGESKVIVSYQTFAFEEPEDSPDKERVYTTAVPHIELSLDRRNPQFYVMDIVFRSYADPELKMLWGRLQRFKRNIVTNPEKTWIFYFNILEKASVTEQTLERDTLFIANIFNPTLFYLTREVPDMLSTDLRSDDGELYGGNVIRMLLPTELVTFEVTSDVDTSEIKGEVQRENEERRYLDSQNANDMWNE